MTWLTGQVLVAVSGATLSVGVLLLWRSVRPSRTNLAADLDALYALPATGARDGTVDAVSRWLVSAARRSGLGRLLLDDDLAVAGRGVQAHTTARLLSAGGGSAIALTSWAAATLMGSVGILGALAALVFGAVTGVWVADRKIHRLAEARRREARLAVAAYLDLVRILLAGGLPLLAALHAGADAGHGWAFGQLRQALAWAHDRDLPPDEGLRELGNRVTIAEFADLAATITSARRGASPVQALESKAAFMRGADTAHARAEAAVADAQIELPAAAVALAFLFFLTYPLMSLISTGTGALP